MITTSPEPADIAPRPPAQVMNLAAMGASHATRLSFMRILLRRLKREKWRFERRVFDIDARGVGTAVYVAHGPQRSYSLVCFGHDLPPEMRSDRVIATAWDATFALHDGIADEQTIARQYPVAGSWPGIGKRAFRITGKPFRAAVRACCGKPRFRPSAEWQPRH